MNVFQDYAHYYDLMYRDKDYAGEAEYVKSLIEKYRPGAESLLDLGCGTGRHADQFAKQGYFVHGIDISQQMLNHAEQRKKEATGEYLKRLVFSQGDAREIRLQQKFDAVVALFHVMSYQTTNADLKAVIKTAKSHLKPEGLFVFDAWYGPGVLSDRPAVTVKRVEDDFLKVTRIAEPTIFLNENVVSIHYQMYIRRKAPVEHFEITETHRMRFLFRPEIEELLGNCGIELLETLEWMTDRTPEDNCWNVCFVARA